MIHYAKIIILKH